MSRMPWIALMFFCLVPLRRGLAEEVATPTVKEVSMSSYGLQVTFSEPMLTWLDRSAPQGVALRLVMDRRYAVGLPRPRR